MPKVPIREPIDLFPPRPQLYAGTEPEWQEAIDKMRRLTEAYMRGVVNNRRVAVDLTQVTIEALRSLHPPPSDDNRLRACVRTIACRVLMSYLTEQARLTGWGVPA